MTLSLGRITTVPALDRPGLLAPPVLAAPTGWEHVAQVGVVQIDPEVADTAALAAACDIGMDSGANCVVVAGKRDGQERVATSLVPRSSTASPADASTVVH